jgi:hypothetical protein
MLRKRWYSVVNAPLAQEKEEITHFMAQTMNRICIGSMGMGTGRICMQTGIQYRMASLY